MTTREYVEMLAEYGRRWKELKEIEKNCNLASDKTEMATDKTRETKIENLKPEDICQTKLL